MSEQKTVSNAVNKLCGKAILDYFTRYARDIHTMSAGELRETFAAAFEEIKELDDSEFMFAFMQGVCDGAQCVKPSSQDHLYNMMVERGKTYLDWWRLGCEYGNAEVQCWVIRRETGKATSQNPCWAKVRAKKTR